MKQGPESETKKSRFGLAAGAAMLAAVTGGNAEAANVKIENTKTVDPFTREVLSPETASFEKDLAAALEAKENISHLENIVEREAVPLTFQIRFIETMLHSGGPYRKELQDKELSEQRFSKIYALINTVSMRLTEAFAKNPDDPRLQKYAAEVNKLRGSAIMLDVEKVNKTAKCNFFTLRYGQDAYIATAYHCIKDGSVRGVSSEYNYFHPENSDVAVKYVPQKEFGTYGIKTIDELPVFNESTTSESMYGKVVISYSVSGSGKRDIDISFATPLPTKTSHMIKDEDMRKFAPLGIAELTRLFKQYDKALLRKDGKVTASGESGSAVSAPGLGIVGNFVGTDMVTEAGETNRYATFAFTNPDVFKKALDGERTRRLGLASR